ncbi:MAG: hypothetical protein LBT40_01920 [Deltaproteobacteria bacterium]|jgi:hypothetical protein|nr:hypothetical protein [Deltaproteobacteria bacterium]
MDKFYKPSGKVPGSSALIVVAAAAAGSVLAPLYAACSLYVPVIYANMVLVCLYGWLTGKGAGLAVRASATLNPRAAGLLALPGALAGFALSWAAWMGLFLKFGHADFPGAGEIAAYLSRPGGWAALLAEPWRFLDSLKEIYETGLWTVSFRNSSGSELKGGHLLVVWILELAIYLAFAAGASAKAARVPYSQEAGAFLREERRLPRAVALPEEPGYYVQVLGAICSGDLAYISTAPQTEPGAFGFYVTLHSHENSPWGTADVTRIAMRGKKKETMVLAADVILPVSAMETLRERLSA